MLRGDTLEKNNQVFCSEGAVRLHLFIEKVRIGHNVKIVNAFNNLEKKSDDKEIETRLFW